MLFTKFRVLVSLAFVVAFVAVCAEKSPSCKPQNAELADLLDFKKMKLHADNMMQCFLQVTKRAKDEFISSFEERMKSRRDWEDSRSSDFSSIIFKEIKKHIKSVHKMFGFKSSISEKIVRSIKVIFNDILPELFEEINNLLFLMIKTILNIVTN
ncbi:Hypothetical predicted protein [Cloeon dipterum]|uniref:Uncharacterized protein n=1 Tax=Cloeon dipterum TaxID=197152 RepID=A0A8S1DVU2_9INSE|nr:Hypothetical predicted protein [Cloeon dipterum]